jgi:hypothetical protein
VQAPLTQAKVQSASDVQLPVASQLCGVVPAHRVVVGAHWPVQLPAPEQTKGQVCVVTHWPLALQD